jgi:hypothetical protein
MQQRTTPTEEPSTQHRSTATGQRWAVVRIVLGQAQMLAATVGIGLLVLTGRSVPTIVAVSVACVLLLTSQLLFRRRHS